MRSICVRLTAEQSKDFNSIITTLKYQLRELATHLGYFTTDPYRPLHTF